MPSSIDITLYLRHETSDHLRCWIEVFSILVDGGYNVKRVKNRSDRQKRSVLRQVFSRTDPVDIWHYASVKITKLVVISSSPATEAKSYRGRITNSRIKCAILHVSTGIETVRFGIIGLVTEHMPVKMNRAIVQDSPSESRSISQPHTKRSTGWMHWSTLNHNSHNIESMYTYRDDDSARRDKKSVIEVIFAHTMGNAQRSNGKPSETLE